MMKKALFSCLVLSIFLVACKKDENKPDTSSGTYPTDGLKLTAKKRALLIMGYDNTKPFISAFTKFRVVNEDYYGDDLNNISLVSNSTALSLPLSDSLANMFGVPSLPYFLLNGENADLSTLHEDIQTSTEEEPILSVAHAVTENDTSWIIDSKVKFFDDPQLPYFYIETYMLANLRAKYYGPIDLRMAAQQDLVSNTDSASFWDFTAKGYDSTAAVIQKGDPYYHDYVLIANSTKGSYIGKQIGTYWPFGNEFYKGDVIGTKDTPIRQYFSKDILEDIPFKFKPSFVTVVWQFDPVNQQVIYMNSYSEEKIR